MKLILSSSSLLICVKCLKFSIFGFFRRMEQYRNNSNILFDVEKLFWIFHFCVNFLKMLYIPFSYFDEKHISTKKAKTPISDSDLEIIY